MPASPQGNLTVLHLAPTPFFSDRGCHIRIQGLIRALNRLGVRNILCTYNLGRDVPDIEAVRTRAIPGYRMREAGPSAFKYLADVLLFFKVLQLVWERKPDIVHAHLHEGALIGWVALRCLWWRRTPLVFDVQGSLVGELEAHGYFRGRSPLRAIFSAVERLITHFPEHFFCSSDASADILIERFHLAPDRIDTVYDGIECPVQNRDSDAQVRLPDLPGDKPLVVYAGGLLEAKGVETLMLSVLESNRRGVGCHFLFVGYPTGRIEQFLQDNRLSGQCTLVGRVLYEDLFFYLSRGVLALEPKAPDSGEASGKLLNYMAAKLPVVCFDTENNRRILGDCGYFAARGSVSSFVDQIEAALSAPQSARERGVRGHQRAMERFSWDTSAHKVKAAYDKILGP